MKKTNRISMLSSFIVISLFIGLFANINVNNSIPVNLIDGGSLIGDQDLGSSGTYEIFHTDEWLDNGDFDSGISPWTNTTVDDTINPDVNATYSSQAANYEVLGEERSFNITENPIIDSNWTATINPDFPLFPNGRYNNPALPARIDFPPGYGINGSGAWVVHEYNEQITQIDNSPSVHWKHNVTMPVNMSDYEITSANISAYVYAEVQDNLEVPGDTIIDGGYAGVYDFVKFYVLLSDLYRINEYQAAYLKNSTLGGNTQGNTGRWSLGNTVIMDDTEMVAMDEQSLIFFLTSALSNDDYNFTITLGIDLYGEDNYPQYDWDTFQLITIKNFSLTFTYQKKINSLTSVSYSQTGDTISSTNYEIDNASLNFRYKLDTLWSDDSPNSEFRFYINGTQHIETLKLSSGTLNWQYAKVGGFDVTNLIQTDVNDSLTIKVYTADNFNLNQTVTISIENVSLEITYTETKAETVTEIQLFMNNENKTIPRLIQIPIGETVNVTIYYNETSGFIDTASVVLTGYGTPKNLTENGALEHYNYTIDTSTLTLGEHYFTVTASKYTYETQEITFSVSVVKRDSFIDNININYIETTSASIPWNETFDISITYNDTLTNNPIDGATVQLTGASLLKSFTENGDYYNISLNSNELQIGANYLTISASATNNSLTSEIITITVTERTTELDTYLNNQSTTTISIPWGELLNITTIYKDSITTNFIDGVTVELRVGETVMHNFTKHPSLNQYNLTLNSSDIGVGINYFTISAKKDNYTASQVSITITVTDRETNLDVYLDKELKNNIVVPWNNLLNITTVYIDDNSSAFINAATVELKQGQTTLYTFTKHLTYDQYYLTLNTSDLDLGVFVFSVYADKDNYSLSSESITITVIERETELDVDIELSSVSSMAIAWGDFLNITSFFTDKNLTTFIDSADIRLKDGAVTLFTFSEGSNQYDLLINVSSLGLGVHALTVTAEKTNYSSALATITITVTERDTDLEIKLNSSTLSSKSVPWGDLLNITAIYNDNNLSTFIGGASVSLKNGSIILYSFSEGSNQYDLLINVSDLGLGVHALTVQAEKTNYSTSLSTITITVTERVTELNVLLNGSSNPNIDVPWSDILNITAMYNDDVTKILVEEATITLKEGLVTLYTFTRHATFDQYYLTINVSDFELGTKALSVNADKANYSIAIGSITIIISERNTEVTVLLNETVDTYIEVPWNDFLNITAIYNDNATGTLIENAIVSLKEGSNVLYNLVRHITYNQYSIIINTSDFGVGVKSLTVYADKDNYTTVLTSITVAILNRETYLNITLNGQDKTTEKALTLTSGEILNITA